MRLTKVFSLILALLGVAAIASLVPLLDAFAYAQRNGGILLVLSFMILLIGMGGWLLAVAWRLFRRR